MTRRGAGLGVVLTLVLVGGAPAVAAGDSAVTEFSRTSSLSVAPEDFRAGSAALVFERHGAPAEALNRETVVEWSYKTAEGRATKVHRFVFSRESGRILREYVQYE